MFPLPSSLSPVFNYKRKMDKTQYLLSQLNEDDKQEVVKRGGLFLHHD